MLGSDFFMKLKLFYASLVYFNTPICHLLYQISSFDIFHKLHVFILVLFQCLYTNSAFVIDFIRRQNKKNVIIKEFLMQLN